MKKGLILLLLIVMMAQPAWALSADGRTTMNPVARIGYVLLRAVGNVAGIPFEISGSMRREYGMHKWLWPVTWMPRFFGNIAIRGASIANDVLVYPFTAPFTNDLSPFTEAYDLPEYPWQNP